MTATFYELLAWFTINLLIGGAAFWLGWWMGKTHAEIRSERGRK